MNLENKKAISEVYKILSQLDEKSLEKLPKKLISQLEENAIIDVSYIRADIPLEELQLEQETKEILAIISYNYFCDDLEKQKWNEEFNKNEIEYVKYINEKYSVDNLFEKKEVKNKTQNDKVENETNMTLYKESFFRKILNKIKKLIDTQDK
jgi:hypothetical protein